MLKLVSFSLHAESYDGGGVMGDPSLPPPPPTFPTSETSSEDTTCGRCSTNPGFFLLKENDLSPTPSTSDDVEWKPLDTLDSEVCLSCEQVVSMLGASISRTTCVRSPLLSLATLPRQAMAEVRLERLEWNGRCLAVLD